MFKHSSLNFAFLALLLDAALTLVAMATAVALRVTLPYGPDLGNIALIHNYIYLAAVLIWTFVAIILSVYDPRRTLRAVDEFQQVIQALVVSGLCLSGFVFFSFQDMSRYLFLYFFAIEAALLLGWRILYRVVRRLGNRRLVPPRNVLVVGAGEVGCRTAETILEHAWMGIHTVGFVDDDPAKQQSGVAGLPVLGTVADTVGIATPIKSSRNGFSSRCCIAGMRSSVAFGFGLAIVVPPRMEAEIKFDAGQSTNRGRKRI
jgi:FlaA1/EpsC-like NDP-sugar epimerase